MLERLKFYFGSVNRHGVHSPFVFDLLEKGLRPGRGKPLPARLQHYFGEDVVRIISIEEALLLSDKVIPPDTVFYIDTIHASAATFQKWKQAAGHPSVRLSLEFWEGGLLFFREDFLVKQHFVLRYKR